MKTEVTSTPDLSQNRKSSFYFSFLSLPRHKRDAIETIYAFCRFTDDIVDEERDENEKHELLLMWTEEFKKALYGISRFSLLNKLAAIIHKFNIPVEYFYELIKGMEMDLINTRYGTFVELEIYCRRVASTVGLICAEVFGYKNEKTKQYAVNLGIALQLTNILRDIKADAKKGRIYLPLEDLERFNYSESDLFNNVYNDQFKTLMKFECDRAREYFRSAKAHLAEEDKPLFTAARTMGNIYFLLLKRIESAKYNVFSKHIKLSSPLKILVVMILRLRKRFPINIHKLFRTELPA